MTPNPRQCLQCGAWFMTVEQRVKHTLKKHESPTPSRPAGSR
jgi:hypothetical protein